MNDEKMLSAIKMARIDAGALLKDLDEDKDFTNGLGRMEGLIREHWEDGIVIKINNETWSERISVSILTSERLVEMIITKEGTWELLPSRNIN